jgi:hypothetical protein
MQCILLAWCLRLPSVVTVQGTVKVTPTTRISCRPCRPRRLVLVLVVVLFVSSTGYSANSRSCREVLQQIKTDADVVINSSRDGGGGVVVSWCRGGGLVSPSAPKDSSALAGHIHTQHGVSLPPSRLGSPRPKPKPKPDS